VEKILTTNKKHSRNIQLITEVINETMAQNILSGIYVKLKTLKELQAKLTTRTINNTEEGTRTIVAQWNINNMATSFEVISKVWPDLLNTSFLAIVTLLLAIPSNTKITLLIKSQQIAKTIASLLETSNNLVQSTMRNKAGPLMLMALTLIHKKSLTVEIKLLDTVDIEEIMTPVPISLKYEQLRHDTYYLQWNNQTILHKPRRFIRHTNNALHLAEWHSQNRTTLWDAHRADINWEDTLENINMHCYPTHRSTNPKSSALKAFKIKLLLDELPIASNLKRRNQKKYISSQCIRCNIAQENNDHWLECSKNKKSYKQIIQDCTLALLKNSTAEKNKTEILNTIIFNKPFSSNPNSANTIKIIHGFVPTTLSESLKGTNIKTSKLIHKIQKKLYTEIWTSRCAEWHKILNEQKQNLNIPKANILAETPVVETNSNSENTTTKNQKVASKLSIWQNNFITFNLSPKTIAYLA
jgi:hypothetical protein